MDSLNLSSTPQFSKSEPSACHFCKQPVLGSYYVVNGAVTCHGCGQRLRNEGPRENPGAFAKALLLGLVAAGVGLAIYAGFTIATGIEIGYVSLAVGFIIGKGMMLGSAGMGGRKYQITAVLLTYAAVSMAFIPIAMHQLSITKVSSAQVKQAQPSESQPPAPDGQTQPQAANDEGGKKMSVAGAIGSLALIGLASPFLELQEGFNGIIGLVILFVGMQIAWKVTRGTALQISGPFEASAPSAASAG